MKSKSKMKIIIFILFVFQMNSTFAQSKKEQIEILKMRTDSLTNVLNNERKINIIKMQELNYLIEITKNQIDSFHNVLKKLNINFNQKELDNIKLENKFNAKLIKVDDLKHQLENKSDSLKVLSMELKKIKESIQIKKESIQIKIDAVKTVTIGSQVWTSKNLDVSTYRNGDVIPQVQDKKAWANLTTGAWCYYDNDASNGTKYGKLYNWYAVHDPRGLAPNGYHIPINAEWRLLTDYLGEEGTGTKMKNTSGWLKKGINSSGFNGTNSSGFSGLPGGCRYGYGGCTFTGIGYFGSWWSSEQDDTYGSGRYQLVFDTGDVYEYGSDEQDALSVRCLRD